MRALLMVIAGARPDEERRAELVPSNTGQVILVRHGFAAITQTKDTR